MGIVGVLVDRFGMADHEEQSGRFNRPSIRVERMLTIN